MNNHWIDIGLCAGLAIVLISSLAIFFLMKIEIARLRAEIERHFNPAEPSAETAAPRQGVAEREQTNSAACLLPAGDSERNVEPHDRERQLQIHAANAYQRTRDSLELRPTANISAAREEAMAAFRRAWNALPQSASSATS